MEITSNRTSSKIQVNSSNSNSKYNKTSNSNRSPLRQLFLISIVKSMYTSNSCLVVRTTIATRMASAKPTPIWGNSVTTTVVAAQTLSALPHSGCAHSVTQAWLARTAMARVEYVQTTNARNNKQQLHWSRQVRALHPVRKSRKVSFNLYLKYSLKTPRRYKKWISMSLSRTLSNHLVVQVKRLLKARNKLSQQLLSLTLNHLHQITPPKMNLKRRKTQQLLSPRLRYQSRERAQV